MKTENIMCIWMIMFVSICFLLVFVGYLCGKDEVQQEAVDRGLAAFVGEEEKFVWRD